MKADLVIRRAQTRERVWQDGNGSDKCCLYLFATLEEREDGDRSVIRPLF